MFGFLGCGAKKYRVDYEGRRDLFDGAKESYRAGETVTVYFGPVATDTSYTFRLDGETLNPAYDEDKGFVIVFTMPEHDVILTFESRNLMIEDDAPRYEEHPALSFHSYDGGGPEYTVEIADPAILSCAKEREYSKPDHAELDGAGYDVIFTFTGLKPGTTTVTVIMDFNGPGIDSVYEATVNEELYVSLEEKQE